MSAAASSSHERKLTVPLVLLMLSLLALLVSLLGLARTASVANGRLADLQVAWEAVQDGSVEGSELVAADQSMSRMRHPVPAVQNAAWWSLGLALLTVTLFGWLFIAARRVGLASAVDEDTRHKNEQAAMHRLLDEMAPLASGDLRVRATVNESMTGALADAFNYAVSELRWMVGSMSQSAAQMNDAVECSRQSADDVSSACADQTHEIHRSSNDLLMMSGAMAQLSADAVEGSLAAQAAVDQTERGIVALDASLKRLSAIHDDADNTTRLMHRLAENLSAIDERVGIIQDVARQTDLLALNTTIRASAGSSSASGTDAANDLGRLSDEVAQLAEVLGQATRDIGSLTATISKDASDTVQSMEHTTAELAAGVEQTQQAGEALLAIRHDSEVVRQCVVAMADKTVEQSTVVSRLSESMEVINRIARQTAQGVAQNAESLHDMQELANELRQSVSDFRLPARPTVYDSSGQPVAAGGKPSLARKAADRAVIHE